MSKQTIRFPTKTEWDEAGFEVPPELCTPAVAAVVPLRSEIEDRTWRIATSPSSGFASFKLMYGECHIADVKPCALTGSGWDDEEILQLIQRAPELAAENGRLLRERAQLREALESLLDSRCFRNDLAPEHHAAIDVCRAALARSEKGGAS